MKVPSCKRFHRKCEDFSLCVNIGESDYVLAEHPNQTNTLYYYGIYGSGKLGAMFEEESKIIRGKEFVNVKDTLYKYRTFHSLEDFYLIGFNTLDKSIDWDGRLISENLLDVTCDNSYIIYFDGNPIVNGSKMKRYDYAKLTQHSNYSIDIQNGVLGLFTKTS